MGRILRLVCIAALTGVALMTATPGATATASGSIPSQAFVLDNVNLAVSAPVLAYLSTFDPSPAGSAIQSASATAHNPYRELTFEAIPYGAGDPADKQFGIVHAGDAPRVAAALASFRASQGGTRLPGLAASLFGQSVNGSAYQVPLATDGLSPKPTVIIEWTVESGSRLWVVRAGGNITASASATEDLFNGISISTSNPTASTSLRLGAGGIQPMISSTGTLNPTLVGSQLVPVPSWWNGMCDTNNYAAASLAQTGTSTPSYALSANSDWQGLVACGPRPYYGEGPDIGVNFPYSSRWGVEEWECVELSMRWMYLAWGVHPYPANGSGVVPNYSTYKSQYNPYGPKLTAIPNNGAGPMPVPGDVLSFGATTTTGHTAVVTGISLNAAGTGTVHVFEENASTTGWNTIPVTSWVLGGYAGGVSSWLHNPSYQLSKPQNLVGTPAGSGPAAVVAVSSAGAWVMQSDGGSIAPPYQWSSQAFYGSLQTTLADVDGDHNQDLVAINRDSVWVEKSTGLASTGGTVPSGQTFSDPTEWSAVPFYGTRGTLVADVNGDGKSDLVAINEGSVWVMLSNGNGFNSPQEWSPVPFFGDITTLSGRFAKGEQTADLVAVNGSSVWVLHSLGTKFAPPQMWSAVPFYGNRQTLVGDVNGDGADDLIALNNDSTWVLSSNGGGAFYNPQEWAAMPFYGTRGTFAADVTGDKRADLIAVNDTSTWAMIASGTSFTPPAEWSAASM